MKNESSLTGILRLIVLLTMIVAISYGIDWLLRAKNFPVRQVRFEGPFENVTHAELEHAVLGLVRGNFFLVDLDAVRERVEALPWVDRASVRRLFPYDIAVEFSEQHLVAQWAEHAWLNPGGDVVRVSGDGLPDDLPRLGGPEGTASQVLAAYHDFYAAVDPLGVQVIGVQLTPRRSWQVTIADADGHSFAVVLDHEQPRARLERFARVYRSTLAGQASAIRQVDLRYTNGFAVEWRSDRRAARIAHTSALRNEG